MKKNIFTIAETFVGAGGSHLGFKQEGFNVIYANDNDPDMIEALKLNNPELNEKYIHCGDIREAAPLKILENAKLKKGELDVLFGGIVCKGFSLAGVRDPSDIRNTFYKEQLRLVEVLRPKFSIIENVPAMNNFLILKDNADPKMKIKIREIYQQLENFKGIKADLRKKNKAFSNIEREKYEKVKKIKIELESYVKNNSINVITDIKKRYEKLGYEVLIKHLNALWYGAATSRTRIIIVAKRNDVNVNFDYPEIKYWNGGIKTLFTPQISKKFKKPVTIREALALLDVKKLNNPENDSENVPMGHSEKTVRRFKYIPAGKNIVSVMDEVPKELKISKYYSRGCTMRLHYDKTAPTLVPGHSNFPVHPVEHRSITVREAATITGFTTDYKFYGSHTQRCLQVGNAVPPPLARAIASEIKKSLTEYYSKKK